MSPSAWSRSRSSVAPDEVVRRSPRVLSTEQAGEVTLLDPRSGRYYTLNEVGSLVWRLLADGSSFSTIVDVVRREYVVAGNGDADPVEADIARLLDELRQAGLLVADAGARSRETVSLDAPAAEGTAHGS